MPTGRAIPGLSEKNRVLLSVYGGVSDTKSIDRYNAFRLGGGPFPSETDDLHRPAYPGAMFNEIIVSNYVMSNLEYRRERLFFMYLHLRGAYVWADRATIVGTNQVGFISDNGEVASVGLTTGFFWNSELYLEYAWDSGFLRNGRSGSGVLVLWAKSL
ncbi:MAG TPA: hypothetical protein VFG19_06760 [Geobacteraceae bacterium]|nr:hypothetical protein [Geobacteraceae bacterium]